MPCLRSRSSIASSSRRLLGIRVFRDSSSKSGTSSFFSEDVNLVLYFKYGSAILGLLERICPYCILDATFKQLVANSVYIVYIKNAFYTSAWSKVVKSRFFLGHRERLRKEMSPLKIWLKTSSHKIKLVLLIMALVVDAFFIGAVAAITCGCTDWRSAVWALYVFFE